MTSEQFLESELKRRTRFTKLVYQPSCESTQDLAIARATGGPDGAVESGDAVFWADHQTRGRGRQERNWDDEPGRDLAVTLRVTAQLDNPLALAAALPVAVLQACEAMARQALRIKWPNDVYCGDRKLSGVLIDRDSSQPDTYRIGVGINVNRMAFPEELSETATSLRLLAGREFDRGTLLLSVAQHIDAMVTAIAAGDLLAHEELFCERLGLLDQQVEVQAKETVRGVLTDINFERLVLDGQTAVPLAIVRSLRRAVLRG